MKIILFYIDQPWYNAISYVHGYTSYDSQPMYGIILDSVYIKDTHRVPYIIIIGEIVAILSLTFVFTLHCMMKLGTRCRSFLQCVSIGILLLEII